MNYEIIIPSFDMFLDYYNSNNRLTIYSEELVEDIRNGVTTPYFGILDGNIVTVGYAGNFNNNNSATIYECKTREEYQCQGYFSKLMNFIIEDLTVKNYSKIFLGVDSSNEKNASIYQHYGFEIRKNENGIITSEYTYPDGRVETINWYQKDLENVRKM